MNKCAVFVAPSSRDVLANLARNSWGGFLRLRVRDCEYTLGYIFR